MSSVCLAPETGSYTAGRGPHLAHSGFFADVRRHGFPPSFSIRRDGRKVPAARGGNGPDYKPGPEGRSPSLCVVKLRRIPGRARCRVRTFRPLTAVVDGRRRACRDRCRDRNAEFDESDGTIPHLTSTREARGGQWVRHECGPLLCKSLARYTVRRRRRGGTQEPPEVSATP